MTESGIAREATQEEILQMMGAPATAEWVAGITGPGPGPTTLPGVSGSVWQPHGAGGVAMISAQTKGQVYWDPQDGWRLKDSGFRFQNAAFEAMATAVDMDALAAARSTPVAGVPAAPASSDAAAKPTIVPGSFVTLQGGAVTHVEGEPTGHAPQDPAAPSVAATVHPPEDGAQHVTIVVAGHTHHFWSGVGEEIHDFLVRISRNALHLLGLA